MQGRRSRLPGQNGGKRERLPYNLKLLLQGDVPELSFDIEGLFVAAVLKRSGAKRRIQIERRQRYLRISSLAGRTRTGLDIGKRFIVAVLERSAGEWRIGIEDILHSKRESRVI